ncbi:hypothetical protein POM88_019431 [Heracleum sosnowskyi]|uniref:Aminotransferase-like plant mobile domain-containing protein n=1 Tax=Heracleum sosnowskyi TaxID=360622 RepID=A0AAD8I9W2_9APIA|nr:hypothetical protein POM88_019431 [Heracleum sosnowskyi]
MDLKGSSMLYTLSKLYNELDQRFKDFLDDSQDSRCLLNLLKIPATNLLTPVVQYLLKFYKKNDNVFSINNQVLSISLEDVLYITGLPIQGRPIIDDKNRDPNGFDRVFQIPNKRNLSISVLIEIAKNENETNDRRKRAILLIIVRCFIVPNSNGHQVGTTFLRFIEDFGQVDSYAWGAALLAFLYYGMGKVVDDQNPKKRLDGNSWLILAFFILRIPKLQVALGIELGEELGVPILSTIVERVRKIAHNHRTDYQEQLDAIFPVLSHDNVNWTPYTRVNNEDRTRYQEQQRVGTYVGAIICNNYVAHHKPHLAAQQFPVLEDFDMQNLLWKAKTIKITHNSGESEQHLFTDYKDHIEEWNKRLLLKDHMEQNHAPLLTPTSTFNPNATILELILKLKSCFQLQDSEEVAAILQSREDKLKQNITDLKNREDKLNLNNIELKNQLQTLTNKCTSLEVNCKNFATEKERTEAELKKCKAECEVYKDDKISAKYELEKVRLDLKMWREKEDVAVERYEKRIAELEREKKDESERLRVENLRIREEFEKERAKGKEEVVRLKGEIVGLIEVKRKAEETSRYWERNYKQCEQRVVKLEKNLSEMLRNEPVLAKVVEKAPLLRNPPAINLRPDLKNREDKLNLNNIELKSQLQTLTQKCTSLEANRENFAAEKERIEADLKKCKEECEVYKDDKISAKYELEKVRLDLKMWREKEDVAVERYEKRIAELEREKTDESERLRVENLRIREEFEKERAKGKEEVVRLKGEIVGLIEVKRKAEETSRYWERNYKQCEPRVVKLEKNLSEMLRKDPVLGKVVEKAPLLRNPPAINLRSVSNGNLELVDENAHASPCAGSTAESPMVDTNGPAAAGPNSHVMGMACGNRMPTENQVVIEIDDSDDEKPIIKTASASKTDKDFGRCYEKDPASQSISRGKRPLVCTPNNGDVGGVNGSIKNKKHKMDSPFPNKASENSDSSKDSITTKDMDELVSKVVKTKPFNYEVELLTAFNKDDELCLNAVCALHRVEKRDKLRCGSQYQGFSSIDATRGNQLAKFLVDGDPQGKLRKSVKELQQCDSKGIDKCRKLARNHLKQLYLIYQKEEDPLFKEYLVKNYPKKTVS